MRLLSLTVLLSLAAPGADAQTMYKCVAADGKTSYADLPCAGKVAAKKEIDVRANLDVVERARRKKEEQQLRAQEGGADEPARKTEKEARLLEGTELDRRLSEHEQMKIDTQKRIKADEAVRLEASRLWNCRRGPAPEKCL